MCKRTEVTLLWVVTHLFKSASFRLVRVWVAPLFSRYRCKTMQIVTSIYREIYLNKMRLFLHFSKILQLQCLIQTSIRFKHYFVLCIYWFIHLFIYLSHGHDGSMVYPRNTKVVTGIYPVYHRATYTFRSMVHLVYHFITFLGGWKWGRPLKENDKNLFVSVHFYIYYILHQIYSIWRKCTELTLHRFCRL